MSSTTAPVISIAKVSRKRGVRILSEFEKIRKIWHEP